MIQGLLSTLQSVARLNSYKDYLFKQESRLSNVEGLTVNWARETEMLPGILVGALQTWT